MFKKKERPPGYVEPPKKIPKDRPIEVGTIIRLKKRQVDLGLSRTFARELGKTMLSRRNLVVIEIGEKNDIQYLTVISRRHFNLEDPRMKYPIIDIPYDRSLFKVLPKRRQYITNTYFVHKYKPMEIKKIKQERAKGNCFPVAYKLMMKLHNVTDARLVHGNVWGQKELEGIKFGHAWVEIRDKCLDFSNGNCIAIDKKLYYQIGKIKKVKRYTFREMLKQASTTGHYGAWEKGIL